MEPGEDSQQPAVGHETKTLDVNKLFSLKKKAMAKQAGSEERPEVSITSAAPTAATSSPARSAYESTVPYPPKPSKHRAYDHKSRHVVTQGVEAGASVEGAAGASEVSRGVAGTSGGAAGVEPREDSPRRRKGNRWVTDPQYGYDEETGCFSSFEVHAQWESRKENSRLTHEQRQREREELIARTHVPSSSEKKAHSPKRGLLDDRSHRDQEDLRLKMEYLSLATIQSKKQYVKNSCLIFGPPLHFQGFHVEDYVKKRVQAQKRDKPWRQQQKILEEAEDEREGEVPDDAPSPAVEQTVAHAVAPAVAVAVPVVPVKPSDRLPVKHPEKPMKVTKVVKPARLVQPLVAAAARATKPIAQQPSSSLAAPAAHPHQQQAQQSTPPVSEHTDHMEHIALPLDQSIQHPGTADSQPFRKDTPYSPIAVLHSVTSLSSHSPQDMTLDEVFLLPLPDDEPPMAGMAGMDLGDMSLKSGMLSVSSRQGDEEDEYEDSFLTQSAASAPLPLPVEPKEPVEPMEQQAERVMTADDVYDIDFESQSGTEPVSLEQHQHQHLPAQVNELMDIMERNVSEASVALPRYEEVAHPVVPSSAVSRATSRGSRWSEEYYEEAWSYDTEAAERLLHTVPVEQDLGLEQAHDFALDLVQEEEAEVPVSWPDGIAYFPEDDVHASTAVEMSMYAIDSAMLEWNGQDEFESSAASAADADASYDYTLSADEFEKLEETSVVNESAQHPAAVVSQAGSDGDIVVASKESLSLPTTAAHVTQVSSAPAVRKSKSAVSTISTGEMSYEDDFVSESHLTASKGAEDSEYEDSFAHLTDEDVQ